jgi:pimeloyl-ACP methyl ester carboxylesterase
LYRCGLDVVLFTLPFHAKRAGDNAPNWPSVNVARTNEGFAHAVFDLRALAGWLAGRGHPSVSMIGMSLGGYTAALYATVETPAFAAAMIPVASFPDLFWDHGRGKPERQRAEREGITVEMLRDAMAVHTPLARTPRVAPERILVISAEGDRIAPPEHAERLAKHFAAEEVRFAGGHVLQLGRGDAFRALVKRLASAGILSPR